MRQTDIGSSHCDKARPASGYYQPSSSRPANTEKVEMTASLIKLKTASPESHIFTRITFFTDKTSSRSWRMRKGRQGIFLELEAYLKLENYDDI